MSTPFTCARAAVRDVAYFFLSDNWVEPKKVDLRFCGTTSRHRLVSEVKERRHSQQAADHDEVENRCQIRGGHVGVNVPDNGAGPDYELSIDEADGEPVEAVDGASCSGDTDSMQCR